MVRSARMTGHRGHIALTVGAALAMAGCGGAARQDADEPAATYSVAVTSASFPKQQKLASPTVMRIAVKNTGSRRIPTVAVTVSSFSKRSQQAGLADPTRPVWIVDREPRGGTTAYVDTWTAANLRPGQTRTFRWRVTAVEPGRHQLKWSVGAGLDGRAKTRTRGGDGPATGTFAVDVSDRPSTSHVDPVTGAVVRDGTGGAAN